MHMDSAFVAAHSSGDARKICTFVLNKTTLSCDVMQLVGFHQIAGIQLVGNCHRHNLNLLQQVLNGIRFYALACTSPGKRKHFNQCRFRSIKAVFSPSLALCYPHRGSGFDAVTNVAGCSQQCPIGCLWTCCGTFHQKSAIQSHQVIGMWCAKQVIANGDLTGRKALFMEYAIEQR